MGTPVKWGSEFLVNTFTANDEQDSVVAGLANGRFVMMWEDNSGTLGDVNTAVHGQVFNADGSREGAEFLVNSGKSLAATDPKIAALDNGGFVATWGVWDAGQSDVHGQIFKADGTKSGVEFLVNTTTADMQSAPEITPLSGGGFMVAWHDNSGVDWDIRAQMFDENGAKVGNNFTVNSTLAGAQEYPAIAALTNGRFVVAWTNYNGGNDLTVHLQMFNANGTKFGAEMPVTASVLGTQADAQIAALHNGRFVVTWGSHNIGDDDIHAQIFNADGTRSGAEFSIGTSDFGNFTPDITSLPDGRFVVTAIAATPKDPSHSVIGQVFNGDGTKSGSEFVVSTSIGPDFHPKIDALADGRLVVTWTDSTNQGVGGDGSGLGTRAQIIDPRDSGITKTGSALNDDFIGTDFKDTMKGGGGDDHLNGMSGDDTAIFTHNFNESTVSTFGTVITVDGPEGHDTLRNFEHLQFADTTVDVKDDGNPLFDTLYYESRNADVFHAHVNALDHYEAVGWHEGRDPNPFFSTKEYLQTYKDAAASGMNPLDYYDQIGWKKGQDPSASFDTKQYLIHNPDVAASGVDPLMHFLQFGMAEGRQAYAAIGETITNGFDAEYYLRHNADVAAAGVDPLTHYHQNGWHEGRNPNAYFDTAGYLAHYADVAAAGVDPLQHYETVGWKEGRDPSAGFDTLKYLAANPDVAAAHINPLDHFLQHGIYEGRAPEGDGFFH
jgi:hypothetical protein